VRLSLSHSPTKILRPFTAEPVLFVFVSFVHRTPLKKLAEPREVATQVLALASERLSGHVTGQVVMVHGGMEGRLLNRESDI